MDERERRDPLLVPKLGLMVVAMFAFGFALVPIYDVFCDKPKPLVPRCANELEVPQD